MISLLLKWPLPTFQKVSPIKNGFIAFWLLAQRRLWCNFLHSSRIQESRFIHYQPPPPCLPSSNPRRVKLCTWGLPEMRWAPHLPWLQRSVAWVCLKKSGWWHCQSTRALEWSKDYTEADHPEQTGPDEVMPSAWSSEPSKNHQETETDEDETQWKYHFWWDRHISQTMQPLSLARVLSGNIKVILDPHDISFDAVE